MPGIETLAPGPDRDQQGIRGVAEALAGLLLEPRQGLVHLSVEAGRHLPLPPSSRPLM